MTIIAHSIFYVICFSLLQPMTCLMLAAYKDASARTRLASADGRQERLSIPVCQWFRQACEDVGPVARLGDGFHVMGLVKLGHGRMSNDTLWSEGESLQQQFFRILHAYSCRVEASTRFQDPLL